MAVKDDGFETMASSVRDSTQPPAERSGPSLKARAIAFLSRREHSRRELQRKLAPYTEDGDALVQLLDELERENWLSNERFAHSLVNRRAPREGAGRIVQTLRQHGVSDQHIAEISSSLKETEPDRALEVWQKKFGHAPANAKEFARQYRFMASRGFSTDCIRRILGDIPYGE
jgi:regulatory protein